MAGSAEYFGAYSKLFCISPSQSSSCSSSFLQMGQCGPHEYFSVACLGITMAQGTAATWGGSSVLMVGAGVGIVAGGIGQSFLLSNKSSEADPALGQGIFCLTGALGMSSSGGGLDPFFWGLVVRHGTSANCPVANLYTITSIDVAVDLVTGIWVEVVATVGVGAAEFTGAVGVVVVGTAWARTLTLYPLLAITVFFLLSGMSVLGPGAFLTMGLVLGRAGHGWVCCGQVCGNWVWGWGLCFGPSFPSNSKCVFIFLMREG